MTELQLRIMTIKWKHWWFAIQKLGCQNTLTSHCHIFTVKGLRQSKSPYEFISVINFRQLELLLCYMALLNLIIGLNWREGYTCIYRMMEYKTRKTCWEFLVSSGHENCMMGLTQQWQQQVTMFTCFQGLRNKEYPALSSNPKGVTEYWV